MIQPSRSLRTQRRNLIYRGGWRVQWRLTAALAGAAMAGLTACGPRETDVERATREGALLIGNGNDPTELDPHIVTGIPEANVVRALFEGLVRADGADLQPTPGMAERWDISEDGRVYTFHLRADARWSNGEPVTAYDFERSFKRLATPSLGSENIEQAFYVEGGEEYYRGGAKDFSKVGYRALDARTVQITFKNPAPFMLQLLSGRAWFPVPISVVEEFGGMDRKGTAWTRPENIVGNGQFVMKEWKRDQHVLVARNPDYWNRDEVRLSAVKFVSIPNLKAEEAAFRAGQLHITYTVPINKVAVYEKEQPELIRISPYSGTYFYAVNVNRAPFDDVRVRRAFAMTIDRETIAGRILSAGQTPAYSFIREGTAGWVPRNKIEYNPGAARQLMAEAGYPNGQGFPQVTLLFNTLESHKVLAEAVQQMWRKELGVNIQLQNQEWGVYLDTIHSQNYQIARRGLIVDPYDPWLFLRSYITGHGYNDSGFSNAEYDALVEEVARTADPSRREELCQQIEGILMRELPILPVYFYTKQNLIHPDVHGWVDNTGGQYTFTGVWLEPTPAREKPLHASTD